jgi:nitrate reductase delta subunit
MQNNFQTFKALGVFLYYPKPLWVSEVNELCDLIDDEALLPSQDRMAIRGLANEISNSDIFDLQEEYVDMFDRVRALSLHLFEHVHGDSRERGQAMIDLSDRYGEIGLNLAIGELPDFIPAFLEYLSLIPRKQALEDLDEVADIMASIGKKLGARGSKYHCVFDALIKLVGRTPEQITEIINEPLSFAEIDKEWEEIPMEFLGADAPKPTECAPNLCGTCPSETQHKQPELQGAQL